MSRIALLLQEPDLSAKMWIGLKQLTQQSITRLKAAIENGEPVFNARLFYNDHNEITRALLSLVRLLQQEGLQFEICEPGENETGNPHNRGVHLITVQTPENILGAANDG